MIYGYSARKGRLLLRDYRSGRHLRVSSVQSLRTYVRSTGTVPTKLVRDLPVPAVPAKSRSRTDT